jgi:hypothetical protein
MDYLERLVSESVREISSINKDNISVVVLSKYSIERKEFVKSLKSELNNPSLRVVELHSSIPLDYRSFDYCINLDWFVDNSSYRPQ